MKSVYVVQKNEKIQLVAVTAGLLELIGPEKELPGTVVVTVNVLEEPLEVTKKKARRVATAMKSRGLADGDEWLMKMADLIMTADYVRLQQIIEAFPEEWERFNAQLELEVGGIRDKWGEMKKEHQALKERVKEVGDDATQG